MHGWARSLGRAARLPRAIGTSLARAQNGAPQARLLVQPTKLQRGAGAGCTPRQAERTDMAFAVLEQCKVEQAPMDVFTLHDGDGVLSAGATRGTSGANSHSFHTTTATEAPATSTRLGSMALRPRGGDAGAPGSPSTSSAAAQSTDGTSPRPSTGPGVLSGMANLATATARQYMDPNVIDPFKLMKPQLKDLTESIKLLTHVDNPLLQKVAMYFFEQPGKRFRPAIVLLVSQAGPGAEAISQKQRRLAEITEMIHTASLMHDDVMDHATHRRGVPALNSVHGNQLAILAGDFLLSRASLNLARLGNLEVVELLSTVIAHLVEGEVMQSHTGGAEALNFDYYVRKTYLKTASLLAHSCKAAILLSDAQDPARREAAELAFDYGKHLGLAFQIQDDILDIVGDLETLGKEPGSDLREGITTAPTLYALEEHAELREMIVRGFASEGDAEKALELVRGSDGVAKSRELAKHHGALAIEAAEKMAPSDAREGLVQLARLVVERDS